VVVLDFENDRQGKLRQQVERALLKANVVDVVSLEAYKRAAAKRKVVPGRLSSPKSVSKVAPALKVVAVVVGSVEDGFNVRILDARGAELWSRDLPTRKGLISKSHASKLAKAIQAAAQSARKDSMADEEGGDEDETVQEELKNTGRSVLGDVISKIPSSGDDEQDEAVRVEVDPNVLIRPEEGDADLEDEAGKRRNKASVRLVTLSVVGTTTWRSYCSRPGVKSCSAYDALDEADRPFGDTVDFSPQSPYLGFSLGANVFPLASLNNIARGAGVTLLYSRGTSQTNVKIVQQQQGTPGETVTSTEEGIEASLVYRYFFPMGKGASASLGYVGIRGGLGTRSFKIQEGSSVPLPGTDRRFPITGLDVSLPLAKIIRLEGTGSFLLNPREIGAKELERYGTPNEGFGLSLEAGFSGEIWGPLGYVFKFRHATFSDRFFGNKNQGTDWVCEENGQCGGVAQESFSTLHWGLSATF
jgi:hypothetical protein